MQMEMPLLAPRKRFPVLAAGSLDFPEFAEAADWLAENAVVRKICCPAIQNAQVGGPAENAIEDHGSPELVLLACARRGQFSADDVVRLKSAYPLAAVAALLGSWCDGPWRRTGDVLPGAWLVAWHQWRCWADFNLSLERRGSCAAWSLPPTSAPDELAEFWSRCSLPRCSGLAAIDAADRDTAESIADALALAGFATAWCPHGEHSVRGAAACICDAAAMNETVTHRLRSLRESHPRARIVLLLNFPLIADIQAAHEAGADLVLGKPFTLNEFLGQLEGSVVSGQ